MPGKFNCYNAMAAIAAAGSLSLNAEDVEEGLGRVRVPGRQEIFPFGKNKTVMVDYAHNGAALEGLLAALRDYGPGKITCVFGCGGERSPSRRGEMGKAASKGADSIIITSDNPRGESPMAIIAGIEKEVKKHGTPYIIIPDRRKAIYHAVCRCKEGGIAVIAGKGHEDWQITGAGKIHFDDREEVLAAIRQAETAHGRHRATAREKVKNERIYDKGDQGRGIGEALGRGREQSDQ